MSLSRKNSFRSKNDAMMMYRVKVMSGIPLRSRWMMNSTGTLKTRQSTPAREEAPKKYTHR
jgi:hypothetical protein